MTQPTIQLVIDEARHGARLDKCLAEMLPEHSRSWHQKQIKEGAVSYNRKVCTVARTTVTLGGTIELNPVEEEAPQLRGENIDLPIIYEDEHMLVINKPAGMVVHPAAGNWSGTVVNALIGRNKEFGRGMGAAGMRPGIVHRLDKDTSGVLVVAKTEQAMLKLTRAFAERKTQKSYAALVYGIPKYYKEQIKTLIGRHPVNRKKMAVVDRNGKEAVSEYELMSFGQIDTVPVSMVRVRIFTGRTHQIRVHMAHCKIPVLGDDVYGGRQKLDVERQMLHAWKLKIPHPVTGHLMSFKAPLPEDFEHWLKRIAPLPENSLLGRMHRETTVNFDYDSEEDSEENFMVDDDFDADFDNEEDFDDNGGYLVDDDDFDADFDGDDFLEDEEE